MREHLPAWASRMLGLAGSASFRRFEGMADAALRVDLRETDEAALAAEAASLAGLAGEAPRAARPDAEQQRIRFLALGGEAAARTLRMRPYREQLVACCALLDGYAVELDTGEGKTLVGALAAAGHALAGRRVHVLSVNDYLAERDAGWMGPLLSLLGVSVGWVGQATTREARRDAYRRDVLYAPVSEVGYDLLRDGLVTDPVERVDPVRDVAIVDEADAVMIDEAMSPLVLAGADDSAEAGVAAAAGLVRGLAAGEDFTVDAEQANAMLTDDGLARVERALGGVNLYASEHTATLTRVNLALHARVLLRQDVDYIVQGGAIRLINTGWGRVAERQRLPDGLHAAIEAKEGLPITAPGVILDTLTVQDLLNGYRTLSGMSGTVVAVADELAEFYRLRSGRVERHRPNRRVDEPDRVAATAAERDEQLIAEVVARHRSGQPVLIGTQSVAESESLGALLRRAGVAARVLNAKNDAEEAAIVARAGERGSVTISTQMSGRGTDIRLGGPDEADRERVLATGGLAVIATGRHPSGRLDAQLRGRSARQGDPGTSIVFASLTDELVQANAPAHLLAKIERRGTGLTMAERRKILDTAQHISEGLRLDRHRSTWRYNRAISRQRDTVAARREEALTDDAGMTELRRRIPEHMDGLVSATSEAAVAETVRAVVLHRLDEHWRDHLALLADIRDGIHLRALAGQNPADEFHRIALREFDGFFDEAHGAAADFVARLTPSDIGRDPAELGLRRPSATWTYMVSDNPLGNPLDRAARRLGALWRGRVLRIE